MVPAILIAIMNNIGNDVALTHQVFGNIPSPFFIIDIILMFIIVQQIDNNFVTPIVVGESTGLHPLIVMISLLIGGIGNGSNGNAFRSANCRSCKSDFSGIELYLSKLTSYLIK